VTGSDALERAEVREMARDIAHRELLPRARALDAGEPATRSACWRLLAAVGFDRALLGEDCGGPGLGMGELLAIVEELAVGDGGMALCVLLSNAALALLPRQRAASIPEGARWVLVPARAGKEALLTESELSGRVACALGAHEADGVVIVVPGTATAAVPVEADAPGLNCEPDVSQMGLRGAPAASLAFAGVDLASMAMGGGDPRRSRESAEAVAGALGLLRAGTASIARGVVRRAYEMARKYAHERRQGGVAIIEHDAVTDMLAAMTAGLAFPVPSVATAKQALALKITVTDAAVRWTTDAVQVFGGTGYMHETGVEKLMRDAKYCQLFPESNWVAQDELVHLEHAPDVALRDWPASITQARALV
jgi:alkylation response protein AidB-like acyl-CoA dehydrogenase